MRTYPLLAGIGITAGENMNTREGRFDHEAWLWQTYGEGIRDALKDQPGRNFRLIHRFHQTGQQNILKRLRTIRGHSISASSTRWRTCIRGRKPTFILEPDAWVAHHAHLAHRSQ